MKNLTLVLISIFYAFSSHGQCHNYDVGDVVNNFTVTDINGNIIDLYEITASGKYVFLDFYYNDCSSCQAVAPWFGELYATYGCNEGDIFCLAVNGQNSTAQVIEFKEEFGGGYNAPTTSYETGGYDIVSDWGVYSYQFQAIIGPDNMLLTEGLAMGGMYSYEYEMDYLGIRDEINPMPCSIVGVQEETNTLLKLESYPNPVMDQLYLKLVSEKEEIATVEIYNILGELLVSSTLELAVNENLISLDVTALAKGQYVTRISTESGVMTSRFEKL